jgi:hypothetical protein
VETGAEITAQVVGRVRVRATVAALVVVQAVASGRVRVRAAADSVVIPPVLRVLVGGGKNTTPQAARLRTRIQDVRPPAGITFADPAAGRVRVRATAAASVIEVALAAGRVRVRATAVGDSIPQAMRALQGRTANQPARARLGSRQVRRDAPVVTAQATGTVRVRATAVGRLIQSAQASSRVRVRARTVGTNIVLTPAQGRVRVRSRALPSQFVIATAKGRVRVRSATTADFFGSNTIFGVAKGYIHIRSNGTATTYDPRPQWPQDDGVQWPQDDDGSGTQWPQDSYSGGWT